MTDFGNGPESQEQSSSGTDEIAASSQEQNTGNAEQPREHPQTEHPQSEQPQSAQPQSENTPQGVPVENEVTDESSNTATSHTPTAEDQSPDRAEQSAPETNAVAPNESSGVAQAEAVPPSTESSAEPSTDAAGESGDASPSAGDSGAQGEASDGAPRKGQRSWRPPRLSKDEMKEIWTELQAKKAAGESIDLEVVGHNRGGVVTQYRGLEVFLPMSHWSLERNASAESGEIRTGSTVQANILEITDFETDARRVTATRRALLRHNVLGTHAIGERLKGKVSSIHDFGIFVDLGGVDGLVHASEISHVRGRHPSELVKIGDEVDVVVKEIDPQRERIYLGMKELGPSPWDNVEERFPEDSVVQGKVVGFSKNGAFVEVEAGIEGFIRMRELSWTKRVQRPKDVLKKGAEIPVRVLEVSGRRQRLSLSYRQAVEDPWPQIAEKYAVGTSWKGAITELSNKGVVVDIGEVEGFLPRGRMGREAKRLPDMKAGDELEVNVIEVDAERNSLIFGLPGQEGASAERGEREGGGSGERQDRPQGSGFGGGERRGGGGGERPGGGGGDRGQRGGGDRGERRDRGGRDRDRDRGPVVPAKAVDEIKSAETVGNFSLGDLLGDQIKSKLGIKEEPKQERRKEEQSGAGNSGSGSSASASSGAATSGSATASSDVGPAAEQTQAASTPETQTDASPSSNAQAQQDASAENETSSEQPTSNDADQSASTNASISENGESEPAHHSDPNSASE